VVHRYFFVCLLCPSFPAMLVAAVPDDDQLITMDEIRDVPNLLKHSFIKIHTSSRPQTCKIPEGLGACPVVSPPSRRHGWGTGSRTVVCG
jgi:hypothetical protein